MLIRTHLAFSLFFILILLPFISSKIFFVAVALLATYIPDIDLKNSKLGKKKIFRPLQIFVKHRGFFHSFTFLFLITFLLLLFLPILSLGFFLGYSSHLFLDSFTPEGIKPFYPFKKKSAGKFKTGGKVETFSFFVLLFLNLLIIFKYIFVNQTIFIK